MKTKAAIVLACAISLFAEEDQAVTSFDKAISLAPKNSNQPVLSGELLSEPQPFAILKNARFETGDRWDYRFNLAFNEYYATEEGMTTAILCVESGDYINPSGPVSLFDLDYHPGFQFGFLLNTPYDKWSLGAEYLWFRSHSHSSGSAHGDNFYVSPFFNNGLVTGVSSFNASWKLGIDMIDLYLVRPFYASLKWTVEPSFGLRAGWIRQSFHIATQPAIGDDYGAYPQESALGSNAWMIGPRGGLQSNWLLGFGFSFFGDLSASLLYTRYPTIAFHASNGSGVPDDKISSIANINGYSTLSPNIDTGLGVKWGSYFSGQNYYFDLSAAYNFSVYFGQNQPFYLNSILEVVPGSAAGNLYLHGVSISTSLLF